VGERCFLGAQLSLSVASNGEIAIGDDCSINKCSIISAMQRVEIGSRTRIGENVSIRDNDHRLVGREPIIASGFRVIPIVIGDDVWIGRNSTIMPGCRIGNGAVIGAHSFVNREIPPYAIAVGSPATIHRYREQ
jgi:acetyltransferase-like isoleucine patch superfamily enzyme